MIFIKEENLAHFKPIFPILDYKNGFKNMKKAISF
jgi:hypothetical protein